jgi:hypothetical protein
MKRSNLSRHAPTARKILPGIFFGSVALQLFLMQKAASSAEA